MYRETIAIIDKKFKRRLDTPLHLAAYILNPYYAYANKDIFDDASMTVAFQQCAEQFFGDDEVSLMEVVNNEMPKYEHMEGPFKKKLAACYERADYNPVGWWKSYGTEVPLLQKMAMRILALTSSSSGCERNWSIYEMLLEKRLGGFGAQEKGAKQRQIKNVQEIKTSPGVHEQAALFLCSWSIRMGRIFKYLM